MAHEVRELEQKSVDEILSGMREVINNMKLIDYLFKDRERAVAEMEKEGMIEDTHLDHYRKNPEALEEDTRRGLYFHFITLAVVAGYFD